MSFPPPIKGEQLMTTAELHRLLKVPSGTLRRWAHEDNWRRVMMRGRTYYSADQAAEAKCRRRDAPMMFVDSNGSERHAAHGPRTASAGADFGYSALGEGLGLTPR